MQDSKLTHASFVVERFYEASPSRVFAAFAEPAARRRWYVEADGWTIHAYVPPAVLKPGATEHSRFSPPGADVVLTNDTVYLEVEEGARLIFAYAMTLNATPLSSSLATVEFQPEGKGTRMIFTEQGAYHDGNVAGREEGSRELMESLARELARAA
jgi:uncharacterized protein YndB with AHSA1/START domain